MAKKQHALTIYTFKMDICNLFFRNLWLNFFFGREKRAINEDKAHSPIFGLCEKLI